MAGRARSYRRTLESRTGKWSQAPPPSSPRIALHRLLDGAEDRASLRVQHLDADAVAEAHEGRARLAFEERFDDARPRRCRNSRRRPAAIGLPGPPSLPLFETVPEPTMVPARERPRLGGMGDEGREVEGHVDAGARPAERLCRSGSRAAADRACRRPRRRPARPASPPPARRPTTAWRGRSRSPWPARPG